MLTRRDGAVAVHEAMRLSVLEVMRFGVHDVAR